MDVKSAGMISWFPIFFPFKHPVFLGDGTEVDVSMWRTTDERKVWYEWMMEVYVKTGQGKRIKIGGTDVHSSEKEGCLM